MILLVSLAPVCLVSNTYDAQPTKYTVSDSCYFVSKRNVHSSTGLCSEVWEERKVSREHNTFPKYVRKSLNCAGIVYS